MNENLEVSDAQAWNPSFRQRLIAGDVTTRALVEKFGLERLVVLTEAATSGDLTAFYDACIHCRCRPTALIAEIESLRLDDVQREHVAALRQALLSEEEQGWADLYTAVPAAEQLTFRVLFMHLLLGESDEFVGSALRMSLDPLEAITRLQHSLRLTPFQEATADEAGVRAVALLEASDRETAETIGRLQQVLEEGSPARLMGLAVSAGIDPDEIIAEYLTQPGLPDEKVQFATGVRRRLEEILNDRALRGRSDSRENVRRKLIFLGLATSGDVSEVRTYAHANKLDARTLLQAFRRMHTLTPREREAVESMLATV